MSSIAITGLGQVSAAGAGVGALRSAIREGRTGLAPLRRLALVDLPAPIVGEVDVSALATSGASSLPGTHRLALAAAREALADAGLVRGGVPGEGRLAIVLGTTTGGIEASESWYLARLGSRAPADVRAAGLCLHPVSTVAAAIARDLGAPALTLTVSTACSSGANAIIAGADLLRAGLADVVLAGGADALVRLTILGFSSLRLLAPGPCRPFAADRDGLNLGEGAAMLVLERPHDAARRGARTRALLTGTAVTCDAHHLTAPDPAGRAVVAALERALAEADLAPSSVAYVNAHGTGTPLNDQAEALALSRVFGARMPPVSSSKSFLGHTLGAAGALEALITVLALENGLLPPTLSTSAPAPGAPEDLVLGAARLADVPVALSTSFAFGGNNAVLVLRRAAGPGSGAS